MMLCSASGNALYGGNSAKHSVGLKLAEAKKPEHSLQTISNYWNAFQKK